MGKPVILAVDDDVSVLEMVVQDLRRQYGANYRIQRAASGQAALDTCDQLKKRGDTVALFVSDQRMPGMSGVEFLGKAMEYFPNAKRALLTAYADTEAAIQAINTAKINYYLTKPWDTGLKQVWIPGLVPILRHLSVYFQVRTREQKAVGVAHNRLREPIRIGRRTDKDKQTTRRHGFLLVRPTYSQTGQAGLTQGLHHLTSRFYLYIRCTSNLID